MELPGIRGKVAIVTGAGGGIGEAYAKGLAGQGARVVIAEIDRERAERVAGEIVKSGGEAIALAVDVASPESTQAMAGDTVKRRTANAAANAATIPATARLPLVVLTLTPLKPAT